MIIIEGKQGKSRKLEEVLRTLSIDKDNSIFMFDKIGIYIDVDYLTHYKMSNVDYNELLELSKSHLNEYVDKGYIVFEYNVPIEYKDEYIRMAKNYDNMPCIKNVILTIQNNKIDEVKIYEI